MSRYVDAEYIKAVMINDRLMQGNAEFNLYAQQVEIQVKALPSIDIVRCKECKWRKTDNSCDLNCRIEYLDGTETDMWFYVKPDDFCSYGERE